MTTADDLLRLRDEGPSAESQTLLAPWQILLASDDPGLSDLVRTQMADLIYRGRRFQLEVAATPAELRRLAHRPDLAVALVDGAASLGGLRLVRRLRDEGLARLRIVLLADDRASLREALTTYDIDDARPRAGLDGEQLFALLVASLRAWKQVGDAEMRSRAVEQALSMAMRLQGRRSIRTLVDLATEELQTLLAGPAGGVLAVRERRRPGGLSELVAASASGRFTANVGRPVRSCLDLAAVTRLEQALARQRSGAAITEFSRPEALLVLGSAERAVAFLIRRDPTQGDPDPRVVDLLVRELTTAFETAGLHEEISAARATLEQRVAERTAELNASREALLAAKGAMETALARETEAKEQLQQFLSMVSHEFRTPLAIIDSAAQMLAMKAEKARSDQGVTQRLETIRGSVRRLLDLVDACLADERLAKGRLEMRPEPYDLEKLLTTLVDQQKATSSKHGFVVKCRNLPARLVGDRELLGLAVGNLMANAIKYWPQGGKVKVSAERDKNWVVISVRDGGMGIPPEEQDRVFQRFYRATNAQSVAGTGIGLSLVRQITTLHDGMVSVESTPGEGSTFTIWLPCTDLPA